MKESRFTREDLRFLLILLGIPALILLSLFVGFEMYRLSTAYNLTLWICLIPAGLILLLIPVLFIRRKLRFLLVWCAVTLATAVSCGISLCGEYDNNITVDTDPPLAVEEYLPFQSLDDNGYYNIWRLNFWDEYSPLEYSLTEDLPVLDGSKYAFPIYSGIVNALYPETTTLNDEHFKFSGAEDGFTALLDDQVDIWFGFEPSQEQLAAAAERGIDLEITPIADGPGAFIIHADNPVGTLTPAQVRGIFSGEITNWSEVGGNNEPIVVYQNEPGSEPQRSLEHFMGGTPILDPLTEYRFDWSNGFQQRVSKFRNLTNAIGFTMRGRTQTTRILYLLEAEENKSEFDFDIPLCAVTQKDTDNENVRSILDFITSPQGQYMVMRAGYNTYYYGYDDIQQNDAPVINISPNINLIEYMPFLEVTKIARLDHEASLNLVDFLPRIDGAAAVFPVYSSFVDAVYPMSTRLYQNNSYDKTIPRHQFFNYSNTVMGYKYLAQKDIDIFFGGYPSEKQITYATEQGTEFVYTPIGYEAFVFFVHKDNPIDNLTTEQLKGIYSGEITNWNQVGGHDEEIVAYQRNEGSGSQSRMIRFMGDTPLMEAPLDVRIDTMIGITESVASYRSSTASIGFSFRYYVETLVNNPDLKIISIDGVAPTVENIQNGSYPEIGYLYAVSWEGNENENVQKLLDWVLSPEGQYIIEKTGYVPIGPTQ